MAQAEEQNFIRAPQTTIYDLNDDVLRETFAQLNVEELSVMADVCSTFRRVAAKEFKSRRKIVIPTEYGRGIYDYHICGVGIAIPHWASFFRKFGSVITSIDMSHVCMLPHYFPRHHLLLQSIAKYCSESLMELDSKLTSWTNGMILEWRPILSRLRKLMLKECDFKSGADASQMLSFCVELHTLRITHIRPTNFSSPVTLPQLKSLKLECMELTNRLILNWQPSLARTQQLTLQKCKFESGADASRMLSFCIELNSLTLQLMSRKFLAYRVVLPQMKSLDLSGSMEIDATDLELLLALNPQLEDIISPITFSGQLTGIVGQYVPNIVKLDLKYEEGLIVDWMVFKNLKFLVIHFGSESAMPVLKAVAEAAVPLEHLGVKSLYGRAYQPIQSFIQKILIFEGLREFDLEFLNNFTLSDILIIVQNLPKLSKLCLKRMELPFAGIPEIIKCGPKLKSLVYGTRSQNYIDNDIFMNIRNAVEHHSEYRPFRLILLPIAYEKLSAVKKLVEANSRILQFFQLVDYGYFSLIEN